MKNKKLTYWRRLDNSAKIFPISTGKKYSSVFRVSAVLKEKINPIILEEAVKKSLETYQAFKVKMKSGMFWYYFEDNSKDPIIEEENSYPCSYINPYTNNEYLFKVTYFENKINIDIFHSLTDGNTGTDFFKEIVYNYIERKKVEEFTEELRKPRKIEYNTEDSYMKNYNKKVKSNASGELAYILKGSKIALGGTAAIHIILDFAKLKEVCSQKEVTVTQYLTAVLIYAIQEENYKKYKGKKPIKICIPVNLKKYFSSITASNFFSYITVIAHKEELGDFQKILVLVKKEFEEKLKEEEIIKTMSANVKIGNNFLIKTVPLCIKKIMVRIAYMLIRRYTTITYSNIGRIGIIGKYKDYIEEFLLLIAPEPVETIKCSSCTFENKMIFTFTTILEDTKIEEKFCKILKEQGLEIQIESNGVLDVIS